MGRAAILLVIGLGIGFGIISNSIRSTMETLTESNYSYNKYSLAREMARTAVHATLRAIDRGSGSPPQYITFNGASDSIKLTTSLDTMWITSKGFYEESTYVMNLKLLRSTKPFPTVNAAIGIRATPVSLSMSGHPNVDGHNWNADGSAMVGSGDLPGMTTMNKTDSTNVKNVGGSDIVGVPPVKVDTTTIDPLPYLDEYASVASITYNTAGTYSGATWGSAAAPVVVYCNGGDDTSYAIKFSGDITGWGILVVRGNIQFAGNFTFYGLVIVDGFNTQLQFTASGTPEVVGGMIVSGNAGAKVSLKGSGSNAKIKYSSAALANARHIGKLLYYKIMEWYE